MAWHIIIISWRYILRTIIITIIIMKPTLKRACVTYRWQYKIHFL
jgi:hypothetical protein